MTFNKQQWSRDYYLKNKERITARNEAYRVSHQEVVTKRNLKWQKNNPDKVRAMQYRSNRSIKGKARMKRYRDTHKAERSELFKKWYAKNKKRMNALHCSWVANNPEKSKQMDRIQYARRKKAEGTFTLTEWEAVKKKSNYRCAKCGKKKKLTVDHIHPLSRGGTNYISNIQPLCKSCNCSKNARTDK